MSMDKLLETKEKMRNINNKEELAQLKIATNKIDVPTKKLAFEEKHKRLTTYIENDVHELIVELKNKGEIRTITDFVNEAFKEYIKNHLTIEE